MNMEQKINFRKDQLMLLLYVLGPLSKNELKFLLTPNVEKAAGNGINKPLDYLLKKKYICSDKIIKAEYFTGFEYISSKELGELKEGYYCGNINEQPSYIQCKLKKAKKEEFNKTEEFNKVKKEISEKFGKKPYIILKSNIRNRRLIVFKPTNEWLINILKPNNKNFEIEPFENIVHKLLYKFFPILKFQLLRGDNDKVKLEYADFYYQLLWQLEAVIEYNDSEKIKENKKFQDSQKPEIFILNKKEYENALFLKNKLEEFLGKPNYSTFNPLLKYRQAQSILFNWKLYFKEDFKSSLLRIFFREPYKDRLLYGKIHKNPLIVFDFNDLILCKKTWDKYSVHYGWSRSEILNLIKTYEFLEAQLKLERGSTKYNFAKDTICQLIEHFLVNSIRPRLRKKFGATNYLFRDKHIVDIDGKEKHIKKWRLVLVHLKGSQNFEYHPDFNEQFDKLMEDWVREIKKRFVTISKKSKIKAVEMNEVIDFLKERRKIRIALLNRKRTLIEKEDSNV